jgi:hypothetical protein
MDVAAWGVSMGIQVLDEVVDPYPMDSLARSTHNQAVSALYSAEFFSEREADHAHA